MGTVHHVLILFVNVGVSAEDSDRQRVPAAVGDWLSDQRVVQHHTECHRQTGETHRQFTTSLLVANHIEFMLLHTETNVLCLLFILQVTVLPVMPNVNHRLVSMKIAFSPMARYWKLDLRKANVEKSCLSIYSKSNLILAHYKHIGIHVYVIQYVSLCDRTLST